MNIPKSFGLKVSGIYCIKNSINGKIYIGSSKNIYYRLKRHSSELKKKTHANKHLQNSYLKYGEDNFVVSILEEGCNDHLQELEQQYINNLNPEYNITREVIRNTPSLESRLKTSATLKEQKRLGILKYPKRDDKKKPVVIYDINCNCIGKYESEKAAGKQLELLYPDLKHSQSIVNSTVNVKNKRIVKRYKNHFLLRIDETCENKKRYRSDATVLNVLDTFINKIIIQKKNFVDISNQLKCCKTSVIVAFKKEKLLLKQYKIIKCEY